HIHVRQLSRPPLLSSPPFFSLPNIQHSTPTGSPPPPPPGPLSAESPLCIRTLARAFVSAPVPAIMLPNGSRQLDHL
ncbi:hypothetical protein L249_2939, partial [Ophiocordyceps polyrhachis-furcata BCC 54312]